MADETKTSKKPAKCKKCNTRDVHITSFLHEVKAFHGHCLECYRGLTQEIVVPLTRRYEFRYPDGEYPEDDKGIYDSNDVHSNFRDLYGGIKHYDDGPLEWWEIDEFNIKVVELHYRAKMGPEWVVSDDVRLIVESRLRNFEQEVIRLRELAKDKEFMEQIGETFDSMLRERYPIRIDLTNGEGMWPGNLQEKYGRSTN